MLLDENGLKLASFEPTLASVLGNAPGESGAKLLVEAGSHQRKRVELRDWLYVLLKSPAKNAVRTEFQDNLGMNIDRLIQDIESGYDIEDDDKGMAPSDLLPATVNPDVLKMLEEAETLVRDNRCPNISELEITLALIATADELLLDVIQATLGKDGFALLGKSLNRKIKERGGEKRPFELFGPDGKIAQGNFSGDGWSFGKRLREDMAAIGLRSKLTTRHLLYSILGNASGALAAALATFGINARDMHAALSRELSRVGRKRNDDFQLTKDTVFSAVVSVFKEANDLARERGAKGIGEKDIHRAFLAKESRELIRLLPKADAINLATLAEHLAESQDTEEESHPLQRYTLEEMKQQINNTIFGQQMAVNRIAPWISRFRFGLPRGNRPAGVFLFLGPTGAGKTQMGKELARYVYGDEEEMLFLEMGQFKTKESLNMFIGSPPGYVGYGEGKLTNGLRDHPECVVLFDEIEKADVTVFDALLRFADEGKISDPAGPVRDGRKCIIVMTTNAGQEWLRGYVNEHPEARENPESLAEQLYIAATKELAKNGYRPEFLGRIDERITFLPFSKATCRQIVDGILKKELAMIRELKGVEVVVPDDVRGVLAQLTFDKSMDEGARGAPRAINQFIISPVIDLLSPYIERGDHLPAALRAVLLGTSDVDGARIELEVAT